MPVRKPGDWNERELKPYWEKLNSASPSTKTVSVSELLNLRQNAKNCVSFGVIRSALFALFWLPHSL